jgi:hypothetical protein
MVEFASETLAHCLHRPGRAHPADENHAPGRERQTAGRHDEARRQFRQPQTLAVLGRRQPTQPRVDMLRVDRLLQPRQLLTQVGRPLEQPWLEPAVEVALGDVVMSSRQVVQALGAGLQVAAPPLAEPGLAEAQSGADVLDGAAGSSFLTVRGNKLHFATENV